MFRKNSMIFLVLVLILNFTSPTLLSLKNYMGAFKLLSQESNLVEIREQIKNSNSSDTKTFGTIVKRVTEFADNLNSEQKEHEIIFQNMVSQCKQEIDYRETEKAEALIAITRAQQTNSSCQESYNSFDSTIKRYDYSTSFYKGHFDRLNAFLHEFEKFSSGIEDELSLLTETTRSITKELEKKEQVSFVQVSENLISNQQEPSFLGISEKMLLNTVQPKEIIQLITSNSNSILNLLIDSKNNIRQNYVKYPDLINKILNQFESNKDDLKKGQIDLQKCIDYEEGIVSKAQSKLARNSQLLEDASKMCSAFQKEYNDSTQQRNQQLNMLFNILDILKEKYKKIPKDLITYLDTIKEEFKKYKNVTEFLPYEEYKRQKVDNNKDGENLVKNNPLS